MSSSPLSIDVYVAGMRPYIYPDQLGQGEVATWAPSSSTLISGPTEGILIDALLTFENADQIADWAKRFGKKIVGVYIMRGSLSSLKISAADHDDDDRRRTEIRTARSDAQSIRACSNASTLRSLRSPLPRC